MVGFGYAGQILKVNLSDRSTTSLETSDYAGRFLGGRASGRYSLKLSSDEKVAKVEVL